MIDVSVEVVGDGSGGDDAIGDLEGRVLEVATGCGALSAIRQLGPAQDTSFFSCACN